MTEIANAPMPDLNSISSLVALLVALSVASERLVEIVKGFVPFLNQENATNPAAEARRKAILQAMAVVAGVLTAFLAGPALPESLVPDHWYSKLALGLLASGGSGFWN